MQDLKKQELIGNNLSDSRGTKMKTAGYLFASFVLGAIFCAPVSNKKAKMEDIEFEESQPIEEVMGDPPVGGYHTSGWIEPTS